LFVGDEKDLNDNDYLVDHSIFFLLVNPEGKFINFFGNEIPLAQIEKSVLEAVNSFEAERNVKVGKTKFIE
jgi:protein SCO1/2